MKRASVILLAICLLWSLAACTPVVQTPVDASGTDGSGAGKEQAPPVSPPDKTEDEPPASKVPEEWRDGGIFSGYYEQAYEALEKMSVDERVGQMILARCPDSGAGELIAQYHLGGLVLFQRDFKDKTAQQVQDMLAGYQGAAGVPLLLATDEEGGTVVRVSSNPNLAESKFQSPQAVYRQGGLDAIRTDAQAKADMLRGLGINVNLAPVADMTADEGDYIYGRTLGKPADETAAYVAAVVETSQTAGISCTLKHFPGYGGNADTHTGIAVDKRDYQSFVENDFVPFQAGIRAGARCVLVSHNIVECMDSALPASLSPKVHEVLRGELGFTGLVMTDDLAMEAIGQYTGEIAPAVQAVLAGNDLLLVSDAAEAYQQVQAALEDGTLNQQQIDRAAFRILAMKYAAGLL